MPQMNINAEQNNTSNLLHQLNTPGQCKKLCNIFNFNLNTLNIVFLFIIFILIIYIFRHKTI